MVAELRGDPELATFYAAAFSPDGRFLVTGHFHNMVYVWDADTGGLLRRLKHEPGNVVFDLDFLPDGRTLLTAGGEGAVRFWRVDTGQATGAPLM